MFGPVEPVRRRRPAMSDALGDDVGLACQNRPFVKRMPNVHRSKGIEHHDEGR